MPDGAGFRGPMQRARGRACVRFDMRAGGTVLDRLHQSGSAKAMLPRVHKSDPEVVFLNTSGGMTGGDLLELDLELAPGAAATATTQTAERAYASVAGAAEARVTLRAGAGARLNWLPQETILFEGSALDRVTRLELAGDAEALMCESVVLGRHAMGEDPARLSFSDRREVWRDGALLWLDPLMLGAGACARRHAPAILGGAGAFATIAYFAPGAEDALDLVRRLRSDDVETAASAWDGRMIVRALARDGLPLRRHVARVIETLRPGVLPRVWQT